MFNYTAMDRKERERKEDEDRHAASHVARVNTAYRNECHARAEKHKQEQERLRQKQTTDRALELQANPGMARDTPSHPSVKRARNSEWKAMEDSQRAESGNAAQKHEHDLNQARAADAAKQEVRPSSTGRSGVAAPPKQFTGQITQVRR